GLGVALALGARLERDGGGGGLAEGAQIVQHLAHRLLEHGEGDLPLRLAEDCVEDGLEEPADAREHPRLPQERRGEDSTSSALRYPRPRRPASAACAPPRAPPRTAADPSAAARRAGPAPAPSAAAGPRPWCACAPRPPRTPGAGSPPGSGARSARGSSPGPPAYSAA